MSDTTDKEDLAHSPADEPTVEISSNDKEQIEKDLKTMAKNYENQEEEVPRSLGLELLITFSFLLGPVALPFVLLLPSLAHLRDVSIPVSGGITVILLVIIIFKARQKSKVIG